MNAHPDDIAIKRAQLKLFDMGKTEHLPTNFKDPEIVEKVRQQINAYDESKNESNDQEPSDMTVSNQNDDTTPDSDDSPEPSDVTEPDPDETPDVEPSDVTEPNPDETPDLEPSDVTTPDPDETPDVEPSDVTTTDPDETPDPNETPEPSDVSIPEETKQEVVVSNDPEPQNDNTMYYAMGLGFIATCVAAVLIKKYWFKN